jgi:D-Tyr-tRNAtyr deacylase
VSVKDSGLEILCVSQFTLHAVFKGNKLDFHNAMAGDAAKQAYSDFLGKLGASYDPAKIKGTEKLFEIKLKPKEATDSIHASNRNAQKSVG